MAQLVSEREELFASGRDSYIIKLENLKTYYIYIYCSTPAPGIWYVVCG